MPVNHLGLRVCPRDPVRVCCGAGWTSEGLSEPMAGVSCVRVTLWVIAESVTLCMGVSKSYRTRRSAEAEMCAVGTRRPTYHGSKPLPPGGAPPRAAGARASCVT